MRALKIVIFFSSWSRFLTIYVLNPNFSPSTSSSSLFGWFQNMWVRATTTSTKWMSERVRAQIKTENENSALRIWEGKWVRSLARRVSMLNFPNCFFFSYSRPDTSFVKIVDLLSREFSTLAREFFLSLSLAALRSPSKRRRFFRFFFCSFFFDCSRPLVVLRPLFFCCHIPSLRIEQSERIMWFINAMRGK